ncbi:MAG: hypothetical protein JW732_03145 [Dehalococcoidia bacterium]|nr:hypothetical protein [Dehalococcoidia bacterium]
MVPTIIGPLLSQAESNALPIPSPSSSDNSTLTHNSGKIVKRAGLVARFHDLRYSYDSLMLAAGVHPEMLSKALGHSKVVFASGL